MKTVPGAPPVLPPTATNIDTLTKQMEDLQLRHAHQLEDIQHGQAMLLQELTAVRAMNTNNFGHSITSGGNQTLPPIDCRCFICDKLHRPGTTNRTDAKQLVDEGLAKVMPTGCLMHPDGSDSPQAPSTGGGVAKVL